MYTYWGSQKQFTYTSNEAVGGDQQLKTGQSTSRISHVEIMSYEETIDITGTSHSANSESLIPRHASSDSSMLYGEASSVKSLVTTNPKKEEEEEDLEEVVRVPSPSESLEVLDSKTRWLFIHCTFSKVHPPSPKKHKSTTTYRGKTTGSTPTPHAINN